jgi:hypothetical protein
MTALSRRACVAFVALFVLVSGAFSAQAFGAGSGSVLPPPARPHATSLADMAKATGPFTFSGNDPSFLPTTPFQLLYEDPATAATNPDGCGAVSSGSNSFTVRPGTMSYAPILNVDEGIGDYPTTPAAARTYFFGASGLGGHDFAVSVDGAKTPLGPSYLVGPIAVTLPDGGQHIITIGAFLSPLAPGRHTVEVAGRVDGALIQSVIGLCFVQFDFTYTVTVGRAA